MSGRQPGSNPPPEVPDEFAVAYREAFERALLEQTDAARHRHPPQYRPGYVEHPPVPAPTPVAPPSSAVPPSPEPVEPPTPVEAPLPGEPVETPELDLPERRGRLLVGTHRLEADTEEAGWFDAARESRLFVPALLVVLALLLVLGAYVLGRLFTAAVGTG